MTLPKIADGAVTTVTLADGAVTASKMAVPVYTKDEVDALVAGLQSQLTALQTANIQSNAQISNLETQIAQVSSNPTMVLGQYVRVDPNPIDGLKGPHIIFSGANIHVVSGSGATDDGGVLRGLGNLIVGYNEPYPDQVDGDRDGSHNLITGQGHRYSNYGGFLAGLRNSVSAPYATVSGGQYNMASSEASSVSGGEENIASGFLSSISGGTRNLASGFASSVSGGLENQATNLYTSVTGGNTNSAIGVNASVSAGIFNVAAGHSSSVSGGSLNHADGNGASVSGGDGNVALGASSSVSGGSLRSAEGIYDWSAGSLWQDQ